MLEFVMKNGPFVTSIVKYLEENAYKNVNASDLTVHLDVNFPFTDEVKTAADFLDSWINQKGFPYINVTKETNGYRVKQQRFLISSSNFTNTSTVWKIPFSFYNNANWNQSTIRFLAKSEDILTNVPQDTKLVKFNSGHYGFYLVNYSPNLWYNWIDALVNKFEATMLPPVDRAGLLLDSFLLAQANLLSYIIPLKLIRYLIKESYFTPWSVAIKALNDISKFILFGSTYGSQFQRYSRELINSIYFTLGWNDSQGSETQRRLRTSVIEFACFNKHSHCLEQASKLFQQWKDTKLLYDNSNIPANLFNIVLLYGLQDDPTTDNWLFVWSQYLNESSTIIKSNYMSALASSPNQSCIDLLLNQAMEAKVIRPEDVNNVFLAILNSKNRDNIERLWQFFKANYVRLTNSDSPLQRNELITIWKSFSNNYFFTDDRKAEVLIVYRFKIIIIDSINFF